MGRRLASMVWGLVSILALAGEEVDDSTRFVPFLGESLPGNEASLFGCGITSTGLYERDFAISPDGREIYFTIMGGFSVICAVKWQDGRWQGPEVASFSGDPDVLDAEPHITPDGNHLIYLSTRAPEGEDPTPGWSGHQNLWVVDRTPTGWSPPRLMGEPVTSDQPEFFPSVSDNGDLYFTRGKSGTREATLMVAPLRDGHYDPPVPLPPSVNFGASQYNGCIAPDASYILFCAPGKDGVSPKFHVSFHAEAGDWSQAMELPRSINLEGGNAIAINVTRDGRYVVFSTDITAPEMKQSTRHYQSLVKATTQPRNGRSDLYWIESKVVTDLRDQAKWPHHEP